MILVFGSINLDVIHVVDTLPTPGQTVIARSVRVEAGGKGANQAVAAARDGAAAVFAGAVGRDAAADTALAGLHAAGVDVSRVMRTDQPTGIASVCVDHAGQNQIAVGSGANLLARADQVAESDLGPGTTLVLQMEVDPAQTAALIRRARARGARIILNLAPAGPLDRHALGMVDWLVVNEDEAAWLGQHLGTGADETALHTALGIGVVCTRGADGLAAVTAGESIRLNALPVQAVDTTGAGDCFVGVFAASLGREAALNAALHRANAAAGLSCARAGSQASFPSQGDTDAGFRFSSPIPPSPPDARPVQARHGQGDPRSAG